MLIELSIAHGQSYNKFSESITEKELALYAKYLEKKPLPMRRIELQLAQLCSLVVNMASDGNKTNARDFLMFEASEEDEGGGITEEQSLAAMGFVIDKKGE